MQVLDYIRDHITLLDGGMGTLLQQRGLKPGEFPERWNITHPDVIRQIHQSYYDAGSHIICTNTFGANALKFDESELEQIIRAALENAWKARETSTGTQEKFVALDIGPVGKLLKPYGDLDFEDAVRLYGKTAAIGAALGADLIFIETMNDSYDTKAALLGVKENTDLPVFVSNAYGEDSKLMTGASPAAMAAVLEGLGADVIGANCSLGPAQLGKVAEEYLASASVPVLMKPNAGLPRSEHGKTVYDVTPEEFASLMASYVEKGIRLAGGCCGTTPEYIRLVREKTAGMTPRPLSSKSDVVVSSYTHVVSFDREPVLIGERINPTGKKKFKEALRKHDLDYAIGEGLTQQECGVHVLDVNVGLPEIDEPAVLEEVVCELQAVCNLPLQIDTTDTIALERALRRYNGKPMINSVNGKQESMEQVFPLAQKYGGLVVCLTLDENGIPSDADGRVEIARRIIRTAADYGIEKKNLIFDTLAMAVSADAQSAAMTLEALRRIRTELGCPTILGISNISFGLPRRESMTAAYFLMALENGLSAAIMNPYSTEMMKAWVSFRALRGLDPNCLDYIAWMGKLEAAEAAGKKGSSIDSQAAGSTSGSQAGIQAAMLSGQIRPGVQIEEDGVAQKASALHKAILQGRREQAGELTKELLNAVDPMELVNRDIIPALDQVGKGFEEKTIYLPQLLMSAEAAQNAFEQIKSRMEASRTETLSRGKVVLATVQGDIHDIGKNIVRLILENYGFDVTDLGKDVPPERIVETAVSLHVPLVGLSALMTTTVPAMEETIRQLRQAAPWVKVVVGGAVMTEAYARQAGADYYAKDAMATVRYAMDIIAI